MSRARDIADRVLHNRTHEDTDGGRESIVTFKGEQSGGEISTLAQIQASHDGTADDEKADLIFKTNDGSDGASPTEAIRITSAQKIGIGTNDPTGNVEIATSASDTGVDLVLDGNKSSNGGIGSIIFNNAGDSVGMIRSNRASANDAADMLFYTQATGGANSERMRIDSTGNVGIGQAPSSFSDWKVLEMKGGTSGAMLNFEDDSSTRVHVLASNSGSNLFRMQTLDSSAITLETNNTERMRILSDGSIAVGSTTSGRHSKVTKALIYNGSSDGGQFALHVGRVGTGTESQICFSNGHGQVGSVTTSGTSTAFNTSSDYRLKENVTDVTDGITRVKQLAPKRFNFIVDADTTVDGFLAHEAATVVPEAVHGTKDEVDDDDNAVMQGIDQSKLVPLLTAALQEAIAKIETLETENTAIKARLDALEAE